jgi:hypothetical protein
VTKSIGEVVRKLFDKEDVVATFCEGAISFTGKNIAIVLIGGERERLNCRSMIIAFSVLSLIVESRFNSLKDLR